LIISFPDLSEIYLKKKEKMMRIKRKKKKKIK
jgi:hypothetical protein